MKDSTQSGKSNIISGAHRTAAASGLFNTANFLTTVRMVLSPAIVFLILYRGALPYEISASVAAGILFIIAAFTDKADGYFARKNNTITEVGKFLDPLADKILMLPAMGSLSYLGMLPVWVFIVVAARELTISALRFAGARKSISFPASMSGKVKMFSQVVAVSVLIFFPESSGTLLVRVLVYLMTAITLYSWIDYALRARKEIFSPGERD